MDVLNNRFCKDLDEEDWEDFETYLALKEGTDAREEPFTAREGREVRPGYGAD